MRVAIDARKIDDFGIGTHIRGLARAAAAARPGWELLLLGPRELPDELVGAPNLRTVVDDTARYGLGELLRSPARLRELRVDVLHVPHYTLPLRLPGPTVVTIHDCIHLRFPEWLPRPLGLLPRRLSWLYARLMIGRAVRAAGAVVAVSEATRRDLIHRVGAHPGRVHVVPNGCPPFFLLPPAAGDVADCRARHGLSSPFVLWVGNPKPHKNLPRLLEAWRHTAPDHPDTCLVLTGGVEAGAQRGDRVRSLGPVPAADLRALYHAAEVLVLPSLYEGFGLPALEAMACGTAVLAADAGGLPEVVGQAGLLVRPDRVDDIAAGLLRLLGDESLRSELGARGRRRAEGFDWDDAARRTAALWEGLAGRR